MSIRSIEHSLLRKHNLYILSVGPAEYTVGPDMKASISWVL